MKKRDKLQFQPPAKIPVTQIWSPMLSSEPISRNIRKIWLQTMMAVPPNHALGVHFRLRFQPVDATHALNLSAGVS